LGGIGCFVSSAITLLIFFPRSITQEEGYRPGAMSVAAKPPMTSSHSYPISPHSTRHGHLYPSPQADTPRSHTSTRMATFQYPMPPSDEHDVIPDYELDDPTDRMRRSGDYSCDSHDAIQDLPHSDSSHAHQRHSRFSISKSPRPREPHTYPDLHPYVMTFTSPIDLLDVSDDNHCHQHGTV
jgi:hypothetical protein